ncbi:MAG: bifunctional methylenetetrahydrofolate dehydrogenase/methenyltetrahydrofolate cyclohydrolase FolD [Solobacterium sp.]|nr:bifunctional methylenetetrahydrofolate dehydrogenase/methenyltetrahydrofolate cyclohydrolase FolD [Solobacterium sp.]
MGTVIYGSEVAEDLRGQMAARIREYKAQGKRVPCLGVILVGDNPASRSYVTGKAKACSSVGMLTKEVDLPEYTSMEDLKKEIRKMNDDPEIDGILLQLPLPNGLSENEAILTIAPEKDVDGLHPISIGNFYLNEPGFVPCTPLGVIELLKRMGCPFDGMNAVVVGRSKLVGTPVSRLLQNRNATVTVCHSHTKDLAKVCAEADILIAAIGKPKFITADYVKEGAYVIDVGVNRLEDGHLCGDVDFDAVKEKAGFITPVPKGVGPMTITMLLQNTLKAYEVKE